LVLLNGRPAKSAHVVKADDLITIRRGEVQNQFRVVRVPGNRNVSKREAAELVEALPASSFEPGTN
jgi:ribosomal 50S subunit-recycling heat shock protein